MATLTDEEKAQKMVEEVETPKGEDETKDQAEEATNQEEEATEESKEEEEKPAELEEESTFTKQFTNLKGDSWEEYGPELEKAYQNSFGEGLKLNQQLQEKDKTIAELQAQISQPPAEQTTPLSSEAQAILDRAKAREDREVVTAFAEFAKSYPQAQEIATNNELFKQFEVASTAVANALGAGTPYPELFEKTAQLLGWQPSDKNARKDAALKDAAAAPSTQNSAPKSKPKTNVTEAQLEMAKKFFPNAKDSELVKELSQTLIQDRPNVTDSYGCTSPASCWTH